MEGSSPFRDPVPGRRGSAGHWVARIGLGVISLPTFGILGWVTPLIAALRTRRFADWAVFVTAAASALIALVFLAVATESDEDKLRREAAGLPEPRAVLDDVGAIMLLVLMVAVPIWWFVRTTARRSGVPARPVPYGQWGRQPMGYPAAPPGTGYPAPRPPAHTSGPGHAGHAGHPGRAMPPIPRAAATPASPPMPPPVPPPVSPPGPNDPAARARARLAGLSERMREQDGGNPGGDSAGNTGGPR